ncbi:hypothetical protein [Haloterrigena salinisoli]|uniref:hypothetical protein n=1 Tax=Haloterrigena salinisoli TaxID=3132747 RepID=UPI0030CEE62A
MALVSLRVPEDQKERWEDRAEEKGFSQSEFIRAMTEAGIKTDKGFDTTVRPDLSKEELRQQRNDLKKELNSARERINQLEDQLYGSDIHVAKQYLDENPEADIAELENHITETTHDRIVELLERDGIESLTLR